MTDQTWNSLLRDQLTWHWTHQLRDRLDGLSDDEYFWEPAPDCWNVRPRGTGTAPMQVGTGAMTIDFATTEPDPSPITTIAWAGLARPCGEAEGPYAEDSLARLVLHINRELIHHLAEVCLLRDLYLHTHQLNRQEAS